MNAATIIIPYKALFSFAAKNNKDTILPKMVRSFRVRVESFSPSARGETLVNKSKANGTTNKPCPKAKGLLCSDFKQDKAEPIKKVENSSFHFTQSTLYAHYSLGSLHTYFEVKGIRDLLKSLKKSCIKIQNSNGYILMVPKAIGLHSHYCSVQSVQSQNTPIAGQARISRRNSRNGRKIDLLEPSDMLALGRSTGSCHQLLILQSAKPYLLHCWQTSRPMLPCHRTHPQIASPGYRFLAVLMKTHVQMPRFPYRV
uniref:Uncharacterized protein n=1 Tax=Glossina austeni TaxID=7395 RepID=A0A1A9ULJ2_GLOAU